MGGGDWVKMVANSNTGPYHGAIPASVFNSHAFTLQSGAINRSTGVILPVGSSGGINSMAGMTPTGNSGRINNMAGLVRGGRSTSGLLLDTVPGLKQDPVMAVDWSIEEQSILEEILVRYAKASSIIRYIKIAAALPKKTVRDVALRCQWMTNHLHEDNGKRRKLKEYYTGKRMKDRKEKLLDSSLKANIPPAPQPHMAAYSFMMHHVNHNDHLSSEVPSVGGATRRLLDENTQVFSQISANIATFKIQDNIDLFCRTRNNITAILNEMRNMPGIMSRMSPLPVSLNEELANTILPSTSEELAVGTPFGIYLKQEPNCRRVQEVQRHLLMYK